MDMDNINFTGLKNIGYCKTMLKCADGVVDRHGLLVQLTDDINGNDLTEYNKFRQRYSDIVGKPSIDLDRDFLHISSVQTQKKGYLPILMVNGNEVPVEDSTMALFTYIAKLTRRIAHIAKKDFVVNRDFKYGPEADSYILPDSNKMSDYVPQDKINDLMDVIFSHDGAVTGAKVINKNISEQMMDYLA